MEASISVKAHITYQTSITFKELSLHVDQLPHTAAYHSLV